MRSTYTIGYPFQRKCRQAGTEGVGDTIQTLEALGQDPCSQEHPSIRHPEGSRTGQFITQPMQMPIRTSYGPENSKFPVFDGIINNAFTNSPEYKLLLHLKKFYEKIRVRSQIVTLVKEELDFATDPELAKAGTFFNNYNKCKIN